MSGASACDWKRRLAAEGLGTCGLLTAVIGSGIMGERLAGGNVAVALLANTLGTCAALIVLITALAPISGAHFNPAVTLALAIRGRHPRREIAPYMAAQCLGAITGVMMAHLMFGETLLSIAQQARSGPAQWLSEFVATAGLLMVVWCICERGVPAAPVYVGIYIASAYWFTASTSFANPAVTVARCLSDTFAGIRPADVPFFAAAQLCGALAATAGAAWLLEGNPSCGSARQPGGHG
jgi:glycerol uptake facilitator-like aquaporin